MLFWATTNSYKFRKTMLAAETCCHSSADSTVLWTFARAMEGEDGPLHLIIDQ